MKSLELLLTEHAPKFIDPLHEKKEIRGITFDERGQAWATDGIQLLRVKAYPEGATSEVRDSKGKKLNVEALRLHHLVQEDCPEVATLNVSETMEACKMLRSVMKTAKVVDEVEFSMNEHGNLEISFYTEEVSGRYALGETEQIERTVSLERFIRCLSVFEGLTDRVTLRVDSRRLGAVQLTAPGIVTVLMCIVPPHLA